jgi:murein DD-endopeptidase MepM/ murein hydrolase activator NlpD
MRPGAHMASHPSRVQGSGPIGRDDADGRRPAERRHGSRRRAFRRAHVIPFLVLASLVVGILGGPASPVGADELSDARARQAALSQQLKTQKAAIAEINAMQADLGGQIASTKRQLNGINANLVEVRSNINSMAQKINVVRAEYQAQVFDLAQLDVSLDRITVEEDTMVVSLRARKALLADRLRQAYDTDRTSMLETFLSGRSFTDVLSDVSYAIDVGEQDKQLAQQIQEDQQTIAAVHQTVLDMRAAQDDLRLQTAAQKVKLDQQLKALKAAQAELHRLEVATKRALQIQNAAYAKLLRNKKNLAHALAATASARHQLASKISNLVAQQYQLGNIPSQYNGSLIWPMSGTVTQDFGCTGVVYEPPLGSCPHFHNGIDIVAGSGCGTPIKASGDGRVAYIGWNYADGSDPAWIVIIAHSSNLTTWYAHMKAYTYPGGITTGSVVKQGQVIGYEDTTGHSTGCHLHWMVELNGNFVNPRLFV